MRRNPSDPNTRSLLLTILRRWRRPAAALTAVTLAGSPVLPQSKAENPLSFLEPLIGEWAPNVADSVLRQRPELRNLVAHHYEWSVGRNSIRLRENYARGTPEQSELDGLIYWDPSRQQVQFVAVAGHGSDQGRFFQGEYVRLDDGRVQRVYDVHYRTKADTPGEELAGTRRRYREIYTVERDGVVGFTLEWWRDGRWAPFGYGLGRYSLKRVQS